jgi:TetR/AcrR family transcriptional repressor of nem operon
MRKGDATRERILEIAEASVLAKGFGSTSIEELIAEAGLTKSGFFYHFKDKNELARGLLGRYVQQNEKFIEDAFGRGEELSDDPLQAFLIGLTLSAEWLAAMPSGHPGCLVTSMTYQDRLFDREVRELVAQTTQSSIDFLRVRLGRIAEVYPLPPEYDVEQLAMMVSSVFDGGIILAKALANPCLLPQQVLFLRTHIKLVFGSATVRPRLKLVAA